MESPEMAMSVPLTDAFCDEATGPTDRAYLIYYDPKTRGFGLRVTRAGAKSLTLDYRIGRQQRRYTIGTFRDPWTVAGARRRALELKKLIDTGRDPQAERDTARLAPTFNELIELWRRDHAPKNRPRSRRENEGLIRQWLRPEFGSRLVADICKADIEALHTRITCTHRTPYRANRVLALLSKLFTIAIGRQMRDDNPCKGVERNLEEGRERYLLPDERERLAAALAAHDSPQGADVIRFLLFTGCRSGEALAARWEQFDFTHVLWTKPSSHTKQKKPHRVPLSAPMLQLLSQIRQRQVPASPWVFPNDEGGHRKTVRWDWDRLCHAAGLRDVRIHDLRHTYASYVVSSGWNLPIVGKLLGHTQAVTTQRYSHVLDHPLREATEYVGRIFASAGTGAEFVSSRETYRRLPAKGGSRRGTVTGGAG
jgi:integrase